MAADPGTPAPPLTVDELLSRLEGADPAGRTIELLARLVIEVEQAKRYLGGIYSLLQAQEGMAAGLGELAPLVMQMMTGAAGPPPRTVIEGERVG